MAIIVASACLLVAATAADVPFMNKGQQYKVRGSLPNFRPTFRGEYFEVYSPPIKSQYSQVIWKTLDPVKLPDDIVNRYANGIMAVTGTEVDVVRIGEDGKETSVPCYESYNHHYVAFIHGKGLQMVDKSNDPAEGLINGHELNIKFEKKPEYEGSNNPFPGIPAIQAFSEHNGNEARQSYHGLPLNQVQPIAMPETFVFGPMQINTRNPDGGVGRGGPLPRASKAPPNATYSGILECPCTTRVKKTYGGHIAVAQDTCKAPIITADECFSAVATLGYINVVKNSSVQDTTSPEGCYVLTHGVSSEKSTITAVFNKPAKPSSVQCGSGSASPRMVGSAKVLVDVSLDIDAKNNTVTITMTGPDGAWFGFGPGATQMPNAYAIVVDGTGKVTEHKLGPHTSGSQLQASITTLSNTANGKGNRTVIMHRSLHGLTKDHYSFLATTASLPFIAAYGNTPTFQQHVARAAGTMSLADASGPTCVCKGGTGTINGFPYNPKCKPEPYSDMLAQHNPTCDVSTYVGGMACCRGDVFLLDADQEIPPAVDTVYFKWRFYYVDYNPTIQTPVFHLEWQFGHIEYDVTQAPAGTPPEESIHTLTTHFQGKDLLYECDVVNEAYCPDSRNVTAAGVNLIMAGGHCHSPACLSIELYNADTGELLCRISPEYGQGNGAMDELGYVWLPPCQWGTAEEGLPPPPVFHPDTNFTSIKRSNSTYYHYGVMAIWQMRGAYAKNTSMLLN